MTWFKNYFPFSSSIEIINGKMEIFIHYSISYVTPSQSVWLILIVQRIEMNFKNDNKSIRYKLVLI